jgi:DNA-directed RNA polymerase subunit H (RpoH/RPB5)
MFILKLFDRKGIELKEGDVVAISVRGEMQFFSEVKYLEKENAIAPFHTFCFHSVEKVDSVPEVAILSTEERYKIWYLPDAEMDEYQEDFPKYHSDWRDCETLINDKCFRISRIQKDQLTLF